ncbi:hypothetical protein PilKf_01840 [Pillotina sp. SPG140]|jgi:uncharacterized phage protein gp47/JayE
MRIKTYTELYDQMRNYMIINQNKVTDFNEGAVLTSLIEAIARELEMLYIRARSGFETYMRDLPLSIFNVEKLTGVKATTSVTFSRAQSLNFSTGISKGTIVSTGTEQFVTTTDGTIAEGMVDSLPIPVIAEGIGTVYNVAAHSIQVMVSKLSSDIVAVSNAYAATGGMESESWADYLNRFTDYIWGLQRTNYYGFLSGLKQAQLIRSMYVEEHFPMADDIWNATVYIEDGSGGITSEGLAAIKALIDGDGTASNPGYRAPGINIRYKPPLPVPIDVSVQAFVSYDIRYDEIETALIERMLEEQLAGFINAKHIGQSVLLSDMIVELKRATFLSDVKILTPTEDVCIEKNQIVRFNSGTIEVVVNDV